LVLTLLSTQKENCAALYLEGGVKECVKRNGTANLSEGNWEKKEERKRKGKGKRTTPFG
jgi:hypothetical protein